MDHQEMRARFEELLPWHVNGSLDPDQRAWVDQYLSDHPELRGEMHWFQSLQARLHENAPAVSEELGMDKLFTRIRAERRAPAPSLMERVRELFGFKLTPAFAMTAALLLVQAAVITGLMIERPDVATTRAVPGAYAGPFVRVSFQPQATEQEIRLLLVEVQGQLVAGPGQLGNYYLMVPAGTADAAVKKLEASKAVEAVAVVQELPPVGN
jgi:hypothetical protein